MAEYTVHRLAEGQFDLLIPLMKNCFGVDVNLEYFKWKYQKNPAGFVVGFYALSEKGELAAYYGVIPEQYIVDGKERTIYQSCDTMTHSDHRRRGLFQKLAQRCYDTLRDDNKLFVIGFGGSKSTPGLLKLGWKHLFDVRHHLYPAPLARLRLSRAAKGTEALNSAAPILSLVNNYNKAVPVHVHKSPEAFAWRTSNPKYSYRILAHAAEGSRAGEYTSYAVYYTHQRKIILFDFFFRDAAARKSLMNYLKNTLSRDGLKGIVHFCQEQSVYATAVKKSGFFANPFRKGPVSYRVPFTLLADATALSQYGNAAAWSVNAYDHDAL